MTLMTCLHCGASTSNGLALCDLCQRLASSIFAMLPVYFRNLARWRPGRAGSREVPGSRVLWTGEVRDADSTGDRISDALDQAAVALLVQAEKLVVARPYLARLLVRLSTARAAERVDEAQLVAWLCLGFERNLTSLATLDWCGDFLRVLRHHEARLRGLTEEAAPGWYAGECAVCSGPTYVVPGLTWVTCNNVTGYRSVEGSETKVPVFCGATTNVRDRARIILDEARDWVAPPMQLAAVLVALVDGEPSVARLHKRISKWGERGDIDAVRRTSRDYAWNAELDRIEVTDQAVGRARYRLGEVVDMLLRKHHASATRVRTVAS